MKAATYDSPCRRIERTIELINAKVTRGSENDGSVSCGTTISQHLADLKLRKSDASVRTLMSLGSCASR